MITFQQIKKQINSELKSIPKENLIEQYIQDWKDLLTEQRKYPNQKSKQYKSLDEKIKDIQKLIFALRASQLD